MNYPFSSYSWEVISDSIAVKQMDKSAFLHHGTGIPKEIASFFDLTETELKEPKPVLFKVNGKSFDAHIQMDGVLERFRLFWRSDFSNLIKDRYPEFYNAFSNDEDVQDTPRMRFERLDANAYGVEFSDPSVSINDWTDEELEASVIAYFGMLTKEMRGESFNKAEINRDLRASTLKNRSKGSIEFRMQNISAVLQGLCHPIIKGYLPRGNVGTEVSERIKGIIFKKQLLQENDYQPTSNPDELDKKVKSILKKGVIGKPGGQLKPKKQQSSQTIYERDPLVKAWVLQNADGICELCNQRGPFKDKYGQDFLEVHHVLFLSENGQDTVDNTVALCPNCHKKCHHAQDIKAVREELNCKVLRLVNFRDKGL